jgi:Cu-Zn family superoxide dismutase
MHFFFLLLALAAVLSLANGATTRAEDDKQQWIKIARGLSPLVVAEVNLVEGSAGSGVSGSLNIYEYDENYPILISGTVFGLEPGAHGFHIHEVGATGDECKAAGPHYNPLMVTHSAPDSSSRHIGDLGNIEAGELSTNINIEDSVASFFGENSISNRAIVVHAGEDDLGLGGDDESLATGNAGARLACGIITELDNLEWTIFVPPTPHHSLSQKKVRCHLVRGRYIAGQEFEGQSACGKMVKISADGVVNGGAIRVSEVDEDRENTVVTITGQLA